MRVPHKPVVALLLLATVTLGACASVEQQQAATMGGIQGAATGAVIGSRNHNTVGGAALGGVIGATTAVVLSSPQSGGQPAFIQAPDSEGK